MNATVYDLCTCTYLITVYCGVVYKEDRALALTIPKLEMHQKNYQGYTQQWWKPQVPSLVVVAKLEAVNNETILE